MDSPMANPQYASLYMKPDRAHDRAKRLLARDLGGLAPPQHVSALFTALYAFPDDPNTWRWPAVPGCRPHRAPLLRLAVQCRWPDRKPETAPNDPAQPG